MEKFNRSLAKEIAQKVQEALSESIGGTFDYAVSGGTLTEDKLKLNLEIRIKDESGALVVSESRHSAVDSLAKRAGLKFEGHLLGSTWKVRSATYTVMDYVAKRRAYPLSLKRSDGKMSRCSFLYLLQGAQITIPTESDFVKWFTIDPDSDAVRESDVTICDKVQDYLEKNYPVEDGDKFFALVDKFNEIGIAKKWAKRGYELLFKEAPATMEHAYLGLKVLYSEATKDVKPKNVKRRK